MKPADLVLFLTVGTGIGFVIQGLLGLFGSGRNIFHRDILGEWLVRKFGKTEARLYIAIIGIIMIFVGFALYVAILFFTY
jgi:predicted acyltransferase